MKLQNVGIFSLAYPPFVGGAEIAIKEIATRIPGVDFSVFTNRFNSEWLSKEKDRNVEVVRLGRGSADLNYYGRFWEKVRYIFLAWIAAERAHRSRPFKAVWAVMASYAGFAALLFKIMHPRVPLLLTLQEGDSESHILSRVGFFYPVWRKLFAKADSVQAISSYLADFGRRHGATCPVTVVPNGINLGNNQADQPIKKGKEKIIITTSRLVYKNAVDDLIRAVAKLRFPNWKLLILGSGPDEDKLKNLAKESGVGDKVTFLGHINPEAISGHLATADVFVRASRSEGLGNSFLEAMAAGVPIIGTRVGGIPDFLKDEETGLFAKADDPQDLSEKIDRLLGDARLASAISKAGKKLVEEKYTWDVVAGKMSGIFTELMATKKLLVATGIYPPDIGGPATYTVLLEKELPSRGFAVDHLAFTDFRKLPKLVRHFWYFWNCFWKSGRFDFVYAQDPVSVGLPSLLAARLRGRKFFIRVAGDYAWEQSAQRFGVKDSIDDFQKKKYGWKVEMLRRVQKFVVGRADLVITPSNYFRKLVGGWIKNPEKVKTIYNGIELKEGISAVRNSKMLMTVGRLVPWKGFDFLIELMNEPEMKGYKLVIIGNGPDIARLEQLVKNLKLEGSVELLGEISREKMLKDYLMNAGIFILNTSFESFSFAIVEAMNNRLPVIATNVGSIPELIRNEEEGLLVEPNNKQQILEAIKKIRTDADFRERISSAAKNKAGEFSISRTVDNLVDLISHV